MTTPPITTILALEGREIRKCFGVYSDNALVGAVVFTSGARQGHNLLAAIKPQEMATLARLWLIDDLPKNAESRVIGIVLRYIARNTDWKLLLSYADPNAGHVGTIYQATGWLYLGQQEPSSYLDLGDGKLLHPRTVYERYGSNAVGHLRRTGIRQHPFSTMALCNIVGDLGYLGFAFHAQGFVSPPKLAGALFTMAAHIILLAHGDDQARIAGDESGWSGRAVLRMRIYAQAMVRLLPESLLRYAKAKPVGVPFAMLSLNGIALLADALRMGHAWAAVAQMFLGLCIVIGCGAFALADFIGSQRRADLLLKIAPRFLAVASAANFFVLLTTRNPFIALSLAAFLLSNYAGFYTRIDKKEPISAGI